MKKTFNINLGGIVFHIDEDAYDLLSNYLNNLRAYFHKEDGGDEIVNDMELRISELFSERISESKQVITITDVEDIICQMGKFEDLTGEQEKENTSSTSREEKAIKRLYRDSDNKLFGGVCSGLAAYMDWDPTLLRLFMLLFCFFINGGVLAYIIAWIVIPQAKTASEKLSMRGMEVNVKNIGDTVTDGFDKSNATESSNSNQSFLYKVGEAIVSVCSILIKVFFVILIVILAPVLFVLLIVFFTMLLASVGVIGNIPTFLFEALPNGVDWSPFLLANPSTVVLPICGILVIGLPIVAIIHYFMSTYGNWRPMSIITKIIFIVLWMIAFFVIAFGIFQYATWGHNMLFLDIFNMSLCNL